MTPVRWVVLSIALLLLCLIILNFYYRSIQSPVWSEKSQISAKAADAAELVEIVKINKHVWDTTSWIVQGENEAEENIYVWIVDDKVDIVNAADGISQQALKERINSAEPEIDIIRMMPGLLNGQRVWEVYYSIDEGNRKFYYRFYRFGDGSLITTYSLPSKFASSVSDDERLED